MLFQASYLPPRAALLSPARPPRHAGINNVQITPTLQIANAFTSFVFGLMDLVRERWHWYG